VNRLDSNESAEGCPFHNGARTPSPALSVVDALGGFVRLDRRVETLHGSMLSRAMGCKPLTDGNKAGIHVWLGQPVMLSRDPDRAAIQMTDEMYQIAHTGYDERLAGLIASGLLIEKGYWHERLKEGPVLRSNGIVSLWTGLLVKPAPGLWLLATGSYNRRSQVNLKDTVIASSGGYTPLMVEFDLPTMLKDTMWIETELACLIPLQPGVSFERKTIRERPEFGEAHNEFYGKKYLEARGEGKAVGRYRKLTVNAPPVLESGPAVCELIHIAGPEVHTIETFNEVVGPEGVLPAETAAALPYVVLRNFTPLEFDFDGMQVHLNNADADSHGEELLATWRDLYGPENIEFVDWWSDYFLTNVPMHLGEPIVLIIPYTFIQTPAGWSTLSDGLHYPGLDGLRGVIATDLFHHAGPVFQFRHPGDFRLNAGDPMMRLLPIPRHLLDAPFEMIEPAAAAGILQPA
jgi:hypothetical protein